MNRIRKSLFCTLLSLVFVLLAGGCHRDSTQEPPDVGSVAPPETGDADDPYRNYPEQLGVRNYEGRTFSIATVESDPSSFFVLSSPEELTGYAVSDAMYVRDQAMLETYGIDVQYQLYETNITLRQSVGTGISGNLYVCDMINTSLSESILSMYPTGNLYDINQMPVLDMNLPWWAGYFAEGATFRDKLYYTAGMASGGGYFSTVYVMMCNLNLAREVYLEDGSAFDIFQLISDGNWTLEVMDSIITDYTRNLDGNEEISVYTDLLAYAHMRTDITAGCHFIAAGGKFSTLDMDGNIVVDLDNQTTQNLVERLAGMFDEIKDNYNHAAFTQDNEQIGAFVDGRALFFGNSMSYVNQVTEMSDDYAIIPCPKGDSAQQEYFSGINTYTNGYLAFAANITDPEFVAYAAEMLGHASYYRVKPEVYDETLCLRLAKDPRQIAVMDTIFANLYVDLNYLNSFAASAGIVQNCILDVNRNYASEISTIQIALPLVIEKFEKDMP